MNKFDQWLAKNANPSGFRRILFIAALMVIQDSTIMLLWNWFVVPVGLAAISIGQAIGIDMMLTIIVSPYVDDYKDFLDRWVEGFSFAMTGLICGTALHLLGF